jgi:hypothetical protein
MNKISYRGWCDDVRPKLGNAPRFEQPAKENVSPVNRHSSK